MHQLEARSLREAGLILVRVESNGEIDWAPLDSPLVRLLASSESVGRAVQKVVARWECSGRPLGAEPMQGLWVLPAGDRACLGTTSWLACILPTAELLDCQGTQLSSRSEEAKLLLRGSHPPAPLELARLTPLVRAVARPLLGDCLRERQAAAAGMLAAFESLEPDTAAHSRRVSRVAARLAKAAGLSEVACADIELVGLVHDIGKFLISPAILHKPGLLTDSERAVMEEHPESGAAIITRVEVLRGLVTTVVHHHERWDGTGYPARLSGDGIPFESRIIAIADAFDAMVHSRTYGNTRDHLGAADEITRCAGSQFDPELAPLFVARVLPELRSEPVSEMPALRLRAVA